MRFEPTGVGNRDQGCVYIVEVNLASGLKFVEVVQEAERECSARLFERCRKPSPAEQLETLWPLHSRFSTITIADANNRDARNVEEGNIHGGGRPRAVFANGVAKLICGTKLMERDRFEKLARPFLGRHPLGN